VSKHEFLYNYIYFVLPFRSPRRIMKVYNFDTEISSSIHHTWRVNFTVL